MIWPVVAYAPKAATKPSIAAQPLNFSASGVMVLFQICSKYKEDFTALWVFTHSFWLWELILFIRKAYLIIEVVCPERVLNFSSSVSCNSPKIAVVFFGNGERRKEFHGPFLLNLWSSYPICRKGVESTTSTEHHYFKSTFYIYHIGEWNVQSLYHQKIITPYLTWLQSIIHLQLSS